MLTALYILVAFLLVLANGFFVASEFALVGVRRSRILTLARKGNLRAKLLLQLLDNLNAYISATQLGITMASLALGWIGEPVFARLLEAPLEGRVSDGVRHAIALTFAFSVITFLHIVLGELAPKTLALERAEKVALAIAVPMRIFYKVFYWPIRLLDWAGIRTVRLFGLHPSGEHASVYTEEELRYLVEISSKSGHLEEEENRLINRIFDFSDATVQEAMVPRVNVDALPITASLEEAKKAFRTHGYSRLPVYQHSLDHVVGVVFRRDLEPYLDDPSAQSDLESLVRPLLFVSARAKLGWTLKQMQAARTHLAIVVDEYGGVEGIVTLEDLLEEIVGEISDEFDEEVATQIQKTDDVYLLDGMLTVRDANRRLGLSLPESAGYMTLAGFLMAQAGHIPRQGEEVRFDSATFTVERVEGRRILSVRYTPDASG